MRLFLLLASSVPGLAFPGLQDDALSSSKPYFQAGMGVGKPFKDISEAESQSPTAVRSKPLKDVLRALDVMQNTYFDIFTGTWPASIDWTAAVMGTQVSATLSSIASYLEPMSADSCTDLLSWHNTVDKYYSQTSVFYFGENAFGLRNHAFDDMLWVVLGWIENIKFAEMFSLEHWNLVPNQHHYLLGSGWHGLQISPMAAHRARIFYDLASKGWDESLCDGGMTWNPYLEPYKNAITNELFTAASIAMYIYFPGDNNTSPYFTQARPHSGHGFEKPHDPSHLENAIKSYKWLKESGMRSTETGLFQDGFHIRGWERFPNGTINPGTGKCNVLNKMVFTYNQGVILSASRGLWMATGARSYLDDGHTLVDSVIRATGWPHTDQSWHGLGRGGILEEFCDHTGTCSQDSQTFKGIFFLHLSEFCRPLWPHEEDFISVQVASGFDKPMYDYHLARCAAYGKWIEHNAAAARATKDEDGLFGMWWTNKDLDENELSLIKNTTKLPTGAVDYMSLPLPKEDGVALGRSDPNERGRGRTVETQAGGVSVLRAHWNWQLHFQ